MNDSTTKHCARCGRDLPRSEFPQNRARKDGLSTYCKACTSAYNIERRAANPGMQSAYAADYRTRNGDKIRAWGRAHYAENRERIRTYQMEWLRQNPQAREQVRKGSARWYRANKQHAYAKARAWIEQNRDRVRSYWRKSATKRRAENPEQHRLQAQAYRDANREHLREWQRAYRHANMERMRQSWRLNRAKRRGAQRGQLVDLNLIWQRDGGICHICGGLVAPDDVHFDHVIPLSKGGPHTYDNIKVAHSACNLRKRDKLL